MNAEQLWDYVKSCLASDHSIDTNVFRQYIAPAKLIEKESMEYFLVSKTDVAKHFVIENSTKINDLLKTKLGRNVSLIVVSNKEYNALKKAEQKIKSHENQKIDYPFSFEKFVVGPSNKDGFVAAKKVSSQPGILWNPLFIYGSSGLGKTHLLKAIEHEINETQESLKALYLTSEKFGNQVVDVISKGYLEIENFKNNIQSYDVLLMDDIQFLAKREKTNEILFSIFNYFIDQQKQLVITSDKGPEELNGFDQRMITRFNLGLTISVKTPDSETAKLIIEEELENRRFVDDEIKLSDEAINYIAVYYANDIRKIKGTINRLAFWKENYKTNGEEITLDDIQDILRDVPPTSLGKLNSTKIKDIVAAKYGVSTKLIDGKQRTAPATNARHVAMYLVKNILNLSYVQIGNDFGGKDHTTVMNAVDKIETKMNEDKEFKKVILQLKSKITSS